MIKRDGMVETVAQIYQQIFDCGADPVARIIVRHRPRRIYQAVLHLR